MKHKQCPSCQMHLEGELIYDTFFNITGDHEAALETAALYGATQTTGRWGRAKGVYCIQSDRTVKYECPSCGHQWSASYDDV